MSYSNKIIDINDILSINISENMSPATIISDSKEKSKFSKNITNIPFENTNDKNTELNSNSEITFKKRQMKLENNTTINARYANNLKYNDHEYLNNNYVKSFNLDHKYDDKSSYIININHNEEKEPIIESHIELKFSPKKNNMNESIDLHK
jgi:hypothetical protein